MAIWSWVKRASAADKEQMVELVASFNELAHEDYESLGYEYHYSLGRGGDAWTIVATVVRVHPDCVGFSEIGEQSYQMSLVRCSRCGSIRELCEGQVERCTGCGVDWV